MTPELKTAGGPSRTARSVFVRSLVQCNSLPTMTCTAAALAPHRTMVATYTTPMAATIVARPSKTRWLCRLCRGRQNTIMKASGPYFPLLRRRGRILTTVVVVLISEVWSIFQPNLFFSYFCLIF